MWHRSSPNQFYKFLLGTVLTGSCLAQSTPLATPQTSTYPGIIQTFEKLIEIDQKKFSGLKENLAKNGKVLDSGRNLQGLELQTDFVNSIILHSDAGYLRMASTEKCRFYDAILTDLLRNAEGKISNVIVTHLNKNNVREAGVLNRKEFLNNVVNEECPDTQKMIAAFQVKTLDQTMKATEFDLPSNRDQCRLTHLYWLSNPKTPYLCQIHEFLKEVKSGGGDPKDLPVRKTMAKIIDGKLSLTQREFIDNLCTNLDQEELFCDKFLNVSFWSKVASGQADKAYVEGICRSAEKVKTLSEASMKQCIARLRKENDLCLYPSGYKSLTPQPDCETLSLALNSSSMRADYQDCPGNSDQLAVTNFVRVLLNITKGNVKPYAGTCAAISAGETFLFNEKFDNDESWNIEACYFDKLKEREICSKTFFGAYNNIPQSYPNVVSNILRETRGADPSVKCTMVDSEQYNPAMLEYRSGCVIVYDREKCFISQCKHKIVYNDRPIDFIKIKNRLAVEYFPLTVKGERFSLHYLLTKDFRQNGRSMSNLTSIRTFFKRGKKSLIYGVGCAEALYPSFFRINSMNQCQPLPFVIDGMLTSEDNTAFVIRSAADALQAPRIISWSNLFSGVKAYQRVHPLKLWTLYGLD